MEYVLTTNSIISCDHPPTGGGLVDIIPTQSVLKINNSDIVLVDNLSGSTIKPGCSQINGQNGEIICNVVISQDKGVSQVLKVNGKGVLLEKSSGETQGSPDKKWSVKNVNQNILRAD